MDRWEYKSFLLSGIEMEGRLNPLGAEGWELVMAMPVQFTGEGFGNWIWEGKVRDNTGSVAAAEYRVVLKRQRQR